MNLTYTNSFLTTYKKISYEFLNGNYCNILYRPKNYYVDGNYQKILLVNFVEMKRIIGIIL